MHKKRQGKKRGEETEGVWYMNQTIGNACGAVALMHTVMNCMDTVSNDSKFLSKFKSETKGINSRERGKHFGTALRDVHDEVSGRGQTEAPRPNADLDFHFISFVLSSQVFVTFKRIGGQLHDIFCEFSLSVLPYHWSIG